MQTIINYIIQFLLGEDYRPDIAEQIGYTNDTESFHQYKMIINPSEFFDDGFYGTVDSLPVLPLKHIEGIPLLYGQDKVHIRDGQVFLDADIIASAYFLLSRYEEFVRKDVRDIHGRFPGKQSLPCQENFIHRPMVDEYGALLKRLLEQVGIHFPLQKPKIKRVYFTHDVDEPYRYRTVKSFAKNILLSKNKETVFKSFFQRLEKNSLYTFPWLIEQNQTFLKQRKDIYSEQIFFFKAGGTHEHDKPVCHLFSRDMQRLLNLAKEHQVKIGLHTSYSAGIQPKLIASEKLNLEAAAQLPIFYNRHHFLSCREPEDFESLEILGITDDFTMGYADVAGFRLGTCRPVFWINPVNKRLSPSLKLHPLTIMDCSLDRPDYMGMGFDEAYTYSLGLIEQTKRFHGDLVLLWHNSTVTANSNHWQRKLYEKLIHYLIHL